MARLGRSSTGKPVPHSGGEARPGQWRRPGPRGSQTWTTEAPRATGKLDLDNRGEASQTWTADAPGTTGKPGPHIGGEARPGQLRRPGPRGS